MNNAAVPHVNALTSADWRRLVGTSRLARVAVVDGRIVGVLLAFDAMADYDSENYLWFTARYPTFLYIDRVVVDPAARGHGLGRALYIDLEVAAREVGTPVLTCEVNERPPNPGSLAFHTALGFRSVGRQETNGGQKTVILMAKPL